MRFFNFVVVLMAALFSVVMAAPTAIEPAATLEAAAPFYCSSVTRQWGGEDPMWRTGKCRDLEYGSAWTYVYNKECGVGSLSSRKSPRSRVRLF
jgi:hypothetical protein